MEKDSKELDLQVKQTLSGANDLLKLLSEINGEIDEFNKNAWKGVL